MTASAATVGNLLILGRTRIPVPVCVEACSVVIAVKVEQVSLAAGSIVGMVRLGSHAEKRLDLRY